MATVSPQAPVAYTEVGKLYADDLASYGAEPAMLTHKWQSGDLLAPHSDIDIRFLLQRPPDNWCRWNERLAEAHRAAVARAPLNRRLLEHPPGFAFTFAELHSHRVAPAEVATWSLVSGHAPTLRHWQSVAHDAPWSGLDERFYRAILDGRLHGRYRLAADSADNVSVNQAHDYRRHCVAWHYLAPCWFAAASLTTRNRLPGKTAALTRWQPPGLEHHARHFLREARAAESPDQDLSAAKLLSAAHLTLTAAMGHTPAAHGATYPETPDVAKVAWTMTAGMLRVRQARWLYYLDPPSGAATGYLIAREAKELRSATAMLRFLAGDGATAEQKLAGYMADLLPTGATTPTALSTTLADWERHQSVVEDFLSAHSA